MEKKKGANKRLNDMLSILNSIRFYPLVCDDKKLKEGKKRLVSIYKRSKPNEKQVVLLNIYEHITEYLKSNVPKNVQFYSRGHPENLNESQQKTYRHMFGYFSSLDGMGFLLDVCSEFNDNATAKMLSTSATHALAANNQIGKTLFDEIIRSIAKINTYYAVKIIAGYWRMLKESQYGGVIVESIKRIKSEYKKWSIDWREKRKITEMLKKIDIENKKDEKNGECQYMYW